MNFVSDKPAFLGSDDLKVLTGYSRPSSQEGWLKAHGFNVAKNGVGRVVLTWEAVIQWQLGSRIKSTPTPEWSNIR
ncbi:DUF4224 domain-containing protein [Ferrovum myxofaciens]|uniref:DUF4224 domain-containing protein n=1 Tax=Ferrovum myxofaciens TaxID=416213 RepID=UPI0004E121F1|nr:DUF4224 domain-containing protein [Ferrovum myxofaciens]